MLGRGNVKSYFLVLIFFWIGERVRLVDIVEGGVINFVFGKESCGGMDIESLGYRVSRNLGRKMFSFGRFRKS